MTKVTVENKGSNPFAPTKLKNIKMVKRGKINGNVIYLFDDDFNEESKLLTFGEIDFKSIRNSSMTNNEIKKSDLIIYVSFKYKTHKILKSRFF